MYQPKKSVVLVGMMGVGKTTIGKKLAKDLCLPFVDLDNAIENDQECTIPQIFEYGGQEVFRHIESRVLEKELLGEVKILATGGGAFISDDNRALIKKYAISVWLDARIGTLIDRTSKRTNRPLLEGGDKSDIIKKLLKERVPYYKKADFSIKTDNDPYSKIITDLVEKIEKYDK